MLLVRIAYHLRVIFIIVILCVLFEQIKTFGRYDNFRIYVCPSIHLVLR